MPKDYIVLLEGVGEGCDYTIGCNRTWVNINCEPSEIEKVLIELAKEYGGEDRIDNMVVYEEKPVYSCDVSLLLEDFRRQKEEKKRLKKEAKEKELLAQLKEKYEST